MKNYKQHFKGKKITVMGLGLLGRGIGYTKFLAQCGAELTVTDLKTEKELASSVKVLAKFKNIKFVLGEHRLEDFRNADMVIKAAGVPLDSIYIIEARRNKIPVVMDASLFAEYAPEVIIVGVTGTRGKSMTTMLIYEILSACSSSIALEGVPKMKRSVYLGGNIRGVATLPLLAKVNEGDIVVLELDSWQLQGFGEVEISPDISVFTSFMPDHMNYYKGDIDSYFADKANIFKYQQEGDVLVIRLGMKKLIPKTISSDLIVARKELVADWPFVVPGVHQRENLSCAVEVALQFGIPLSKIKKVVKNFKGVEGRLQYIKTVKGVKIYNDNNATTPEATISGLEAVGDKKKKNIVLIAGGATKNLNLTPLIRTLNMYCKHLVLLKGTGTDELVKNLKLKTTYHIVDNIQDAAVDAAAAASRGDIVMLSPAFASFGMFVNEYDRNDQFMKIVKKLK